MRVKFLLIVLFIFSALNFIISKPKTPVIVYNEEKMINLITNIIQNKLPDFIEILYYDFKLLNGDQLTEKSINDSIYLKLKEFQNNEEAKYKITFIKDINFAELKIETDFIKNQNEEELVAFGKYLKKDAVLYGSITIIENAYRKIWDDDLKKFVKKNVALIQGNFFSTENNSPLLRFTYYFLIDL